MLLFMVLVTNFCAFAQDSTVAMNSLNLSLHWQATLIPQYHFDFTAPYSGKNSVLTSEPVATSFTTTLFLNYKIAKNTYLIFNPEAVGGKAISKTQGIAGFPNGETYRIGDSKIKPFIARLYVEQRFGLSSKTENIDDDENQIKETTHRDYISVIAGKFSLTDFFNASEISHDPRTQFLNWSIMGSGAWDYPANTRGYTMGAIIQAKYNLLSLKYANVAMPTTANGPNLQWKGQDVMGQVLELSANQFSLFKLYKKQTIYHNLFFGLTSNRANMGNYDSSIAIAKRTNTVPDITDSRQLGRTKNGYYATLDNTLDNFHLFVKYSKNDGKNETYAFTEIDESKATGIQLDGAIWKRKDDLLGISVVKNDISNNHRTYLADGGYGFIIGDGKLNYSSEKIIEAYYLYQPSKHLALTADYQYVQNPAYNKDRGPIKLIALRLHLTL